MNPKVSVIMPSLNVAEYIEEALLSALNQTLKEIEIVCIDAGSTDGTWEILQRYSQDNRWSSRIKLIHSEIKSYGYQVNLGIKEAKGEYIAILETDDYVELNMYEELYKIAFNSDVDFVKADCDYFVTLKNKRKRFDRVKLWWKEKDVHNYNKIIYPQQNLCLYIKDFNVWKGIYKRSFLLKNDIWFNESLGASYQDIGFTELVLSYAQKAYYSDASYYRYRFDREFSSVNSLFGLKYAYQEFRRLLEDESISKKITYKKGLYYHMVASFIGEYDKILLRLNFQFNKEHMGEYYNWFKEIFTKDFEEQILLVDEENNDLILQLQQILYDNEWYNDNKKKQYLQEREKYNIVGKQCIDRNVFIFGAGSYGKKIIHCLQKIDIEPVAVCDNKSELWGTEFRGIDVLSPKDSIKQFNKCDGIFIIANKFYANEIKKQLIEEGIKEQFIVDGSIMLE